MKGVRKVSLKTIFKKQAQEKRAQQKAAERAREIAEIRASLAKQKAEELKIQAICKKVARTIINPNRRVTVQVNGDIADFSINELVQKQKGTLSTSNSDWAPWSISYRK